MTRPPDLAGLVDGIVAEARRGPGPVKWCKRCSRRHPARQPCQLVKVKARTRGGRAVERLTAP